MDMPGAEVNDLNTVRRFLGGAGTQTATITAGGSPGLAITETWNGTNWTEVNDLNTGRSSNGGVTGSTTAALVFGGGPA